MEKKLVSDKSYLKRKKGESLIFDIYINTIDIITIESDKGKSTLKIENRNKLIIKLPAYIRKKSKNRFTLLSICKNICKYNYNSMNAKDINSNNDLELENITPYNPKKKKNVKKHLPTPIIIKLKMKVMMEN